MNKRLLKYLSAFKNNLGEPIVPQMTAWGAIIGFGSQPLGGIIWPDPKATMKNIVTGSKGLSPIDVIGVREKLRERMKQDFTLEERKKSVRRSFRNAIIGTGAGFTLGSIAVPIIKKYKH